MIGTDGERDTEASVLWAWLNVDDDDESPLKKNNSFQIYVTCYLFTKSFFAEVWDTGLGASGGVMVSKLD